MVRRAGPLPVVGKRRTVVVEDNEMLAKMVRQIVDSESDLEFRRASIVRSCRQDQTQVLA